MKNEGLIDIREQIFRHFDRKTLENCREVFGTRYGEDWDLWLEKLILVQSILEFSDKNDKYKDFIPEWDKAVKKYGKTASIEDLDEVKESLQELWDWKRLNLNNLLCYAAEEGHVKLMELLLHTDFTKNEGHRAFMAACENGHTEIVDLLMNASKEHGIDLNASNVYGKTGFMVACENGHTEIVNLMMNASKEHVIDLNASNYYGDTGLIWAISGGHTEIAKLMIENRAKYGINIKQEDKYGCTALDIVNGEIEWQYLSEKKKATFKELKHMLEEAYLEDNEPQPTI